MQLITAFHKNVNGLFLVGFRDDFTVK